MEIFQDKILGEEWQEVLNFFQQRLGKQPDLPAILFIIGHRTLGKHQLKFSKEQKQDVIHVGVCTLLSNEGYYTYTHTDEDGWPHFTYNRNAPKLTHEEQELLLKQQIIQYIRNI